MGKIIATIEIIYDEGNKKILVEAQLENSRKEEIEEALNYVLKQVQEKKEVSRA